MSGAEDGYIYTGDVSTYLVTMLRRDTRKNTAKIKIERCVHGENTIPAGSEVTVPLKRVKLNVWKGTPIFTDPDIPPGWMGSYHIGDGVFRQHCRACPEIFDSPPYSGGVARYFGIGPHEVEAHGLEVPGINVGILS